jgi:hypothetical protein
MGQKLNFTCLFFSVSMPVMQPCVFKTVMNEHLSVIYFTPQSVV